MEKAENTPKKKLKWLSLFKVCSLRHSNVNVAIKLQSNTHCEFRNILYQCAESFKYLNSQMEISKQNKKGKYTCTY